MQVKRGKTLGWTSSAETARFRAAMEEQQRQRLAQRLKDLRKYKGWTEPELAHEAGVSIQTISRLENGQTENPRDNTIQRLANAYKMTREELAGPRTSPEEMDRAYESQLDDIKAKLELLLSRSTAPATQEEAEETFQQELEAADELDERPEPGSGQADDESGEKDPSGQGPRR